MAFKQTKASSASVESPEALFRDLTGRKFPNLLTQQSDVIRAYMTTGLDKPDVAYQLPTGGGKTLIGLLIAEWRRRKYQERVVYLCPTNQLVHQVVQKAAAEYGFMPTAFTGSSDAYSQQAKSDYWASSTIAVTSYSSLFNINPFFKDPGVIVLDDAHAAEDYIVSPWSMRIERQDTELRPLFDALVAVLAPTLPQTDVARMREPNMSLWDRTWVDKVPTPVLHERMPELVAAVDAHVAGTKARFAWSFIRDQVLSCHIYLASHEILVRPLLAPTSAHPPFTDANQRIYMSATLGEGGELERLSGRKHIHRLATPQGWEKQSVGRRLFFFPSRRLEAEPALELTAKMVEMAGRALVITSDDRRAGELREALGTHLQAPMLDVRDIEHGPAPFLDKEQAVLVIANRYEGMDFIDDQCRLLVLDDVSRTSNLQERFLSVRMGSGALLSDRVLTRVQQAFGRCTRSDNDFSAVVVLEGETAAFLMKAEPRKHLIPEVQAEIQVGFENSDLPSSELLENLNIFLAQGAEWSAANEIILTRREDCQQEPLPGTTEFGSVVNAEIDYQRAMWRQDYPEALAQCRIVLTGLTSAKLQGYRALWNYLAGSAAFLAATAGHTDLNATARDYFERAQKATIALPWLTTLRHLTPDMVEDVAFDPTLMTVVERLEIKLAEVGTVTDRRYSQLEDSIRTGLATNTAASFEEAQKKLGELLGYDAGKEESNGSPDPWWLASPQLCFVFEDHTDAQPTSALHVTKARQAQSHPNWIRNRNMVLREDMSEVIPILVTPVGRADPDALIHLEGVCLWPLDEFRKWAETALTVVRDVRRTFTGPGSIAWRTDVMQQYVQYQIDPSGLARVLKASPAKARLDAGSQMTADI